MNGLLFPGQGSQSVGMGMELYEKLPEAKTLLDEADAILGYSIKDIMFGGPQEKLTDTKFAQPAIFICSAMYLEKLKSDGIDYSYVAGHSLGEYSALLAADVFDFRTGLQLVAARGEIMSRMNGRGTMAAVMGLSEEELALLLSEDVVMANLNSKTQIVISGTKAAVDEVGHKLEGNEAVKFKELRVSAAFHSPQMAEAAEAMKEIIGKIDLKAPKCFVVSNVTGKPSMDIGEIRENLLAHITGQVRWSDSVLAMKEAGVTMLYEVGHGEVLKKLNKTITFRPKCVSVEI